MPVAVLQTIPLLRIFDVAKAKEFYAGFLGFTVDWEHRFDDVAPVYMQVSRAGCVLHLTEHHGDCCPGSTVFVRMTGLDEFHREITAKGYGPMRPGVERTYRTHGTGEEVAHTQIKSPEDYPSGRRKDAGYSLRH